MGDAESFRRVPDEIFLKGVKVVIGKRDFPEHFDEVELFLRREALLDPLEEHVIVVDHLVFAFRDTDERLRGFRRQAEFLGDHLLERFMLGGVEIAVEPGGFDEQGGGSGMFAVRAKFLATATGLEKVQKVLEHQYPRRETVRI